MKIAQMGTSPPQATGPRAINKIKSFSDDWLTILLGLNTKTILLSYGETN